MCVCACVYQYGYIRSSWFPILASLHKLHTAMYACVHVCAQSGARVTLTFAILILFSAWQYFF